MNTTTKLTAGLAVVALALVAFTATAQTSTYGTLVKQGDDDFIVQFVALNTGTGSKAPAALELITYNPDGTSTGDERYFLRLNTDTDDSRANVQVGDIDLQTGSLVGSGHAALNYAASTLTESGTTFDLVVVTVDDEEFWYLKGAGNADGNDVQRGDLRITPFDIDGVDYEEGTLVGLGDDDITTGDAGTAHPDLALADLSWFDADDDRQFSNADQVLYNPVAVAALAQIDDLRIHGGEGFGTLVEVGDADHIPQFVDYTVPSNGIQNEAFQVIVYDPDDERSFDEVYFLRLMIDQDTLTDKLQVGDINLQTGAQVQAGGAELGYGSADLTRFQDGAGVDLLPLIDATFEGEIIWFFDWDGSESITNGDVRLTSVNVPGGTTYDAGSMVTPTTDSDVDWGYTGEANRMLAYVGDATTVLANGGTAAAATWSLLWVERELRWFDADDDDEFNMGDAILHQPAPSVLASFDDVRLFGGDGAFGSEVKPGDDDYIHQFQAATNMEEAIAGNELTIVEYDPDNTVDGDEEYFLRFNEDSDTGRNQLQAGDLNLRTGAVLEAGDAELNYADADLDEAWADDLNMVHGAFEGENYWYFDVDANMGISRHDIRLTAINADGQNYAAGTRVLANDNDLALAGGAIVETDYAAADRTTISWFDADDNDEWSDGDALLLSPDVAPAFAVNGLAQLDDLRLHGNIGSGGGNQNPTTTTGPTTTGPTNTGDTTTGPTNTGDTTGPGTTDGGDATTTTQPGTPGFELVALVAALGAALVLVRRRL